ncbi:hypothetical protein BpHYR1_036056 [Brachionus plicatilis]|uniref:Uncharacterized protein n=1 Tax=Brachionus plicatilis TaxID=10195 RepID=A0A3M7RZ96_BRAPC|nr:hypothetical protein BpHYR1_036056 [Brachionus plicatilis]
MMYPDIDPSNTSSSENTEPSSEDTDTETYQVAPRQTRPIPPSGFNKTAIVQQNVKNSRRKNRDYQLMFESLKQPNTLLN